MAPNDFMTQFADRIKKRRETTNQNQTSEVGGLSPSTSRHASNDFMTKFANRISERRSTLGLDRDIDDNFIRSFFSDANSYLKSAKTTYDSIGYSTAQSAYDAQTKTVQDLTSRASTISAYLRRNRDKMDSKSYSALMTQLDDVSGSVRSANDAFRSAKDYYSQWETETDYNRWDLYKGKSYSELSAVLEGMEDGEEKDWLSKYAASVNYDEKSKLDIDKATKELEEFGDFYNSSINIGLWYDAYQRGSVPFDAKKMEYYDRYVNEYGSDLYAVENAYNQKKIYLRDAERIQEGIRLSSVTENDDFEANSGYVSTEVGNGWDKVWSEYGLGYSDLTYEYINGDEDFRSEVKQKHTVFSSGRGESRYEENGYDYMNENEVAIYNYYYAREGKEAAEKYLDSIQETLNHRKGTAMFEGMEDKTLLELTFGVAAGLNQFESGMKSAWNSITGNDEYVAPSAEQIASSMVREDLSDVDLKWYNVKEGEWNDAKFFGKSLGQVGYDSVTTTANMLPSIFTSVAIGALSKTAGTAFAAKAFATAGQIAGTGMMGASAAGNAYQEMINLGYDKAHARGYAALVGGSEAGLQYLLGGIGKLGGKLNGNAVTKMLNGIDNAFARTAIKLGGSMLSEGIEEGLQEVLTPWFQNIALNMESNVNWNDVAYSSLLGALTAGFMEGGGTISGEVETYKTGRKLQKADISAQRLTEIGNTFSADTVAYQLAGRVNENTGAYTMGRLFNEIGAELSEANKADIAQELERRSVSAKDAKVMVDAMADVVLGAEFTDKQIAMLEANDVLAKAFVDVIVNPNSTVNQRSQGYKEILSDLTKQKTSNTAQTEPISQIGGNVTTENTVSTETETASQGDYEASVEGKAIRKSTGEAVNIKEVASVDAGKMTLRLEDGSEVDSQEIAYSNAGEAYVYETVANLGVDAKDATRLVNAFHNSGVEGKSFADGMRLAFEYGYGNFSQRELAQREFAGNIPRMYINTAYEIGQKMREQETNVGTQYSFKGYADDGKGIYESNFPKGTPRKAKGERILKYIQEVWSKKPITLRISDGGETRYIKAQFDPNYDETEGAKSDARKLMGGNRHGNAAEQRVTLDLADDYYQIASESEYNYSKDETGKDTDPHQGVKNWHYFINDIYFAEQGSEDLNPYRVSINVKENSDGNFFYSFSAEKTEGTSTQRTLHAAVNSSKTTANGSSSKTSIRNSGETVNKKVSGKARGVYYTTKDGKAIPVDQAEKNGKLALKDKQSVAVKTAKFLQKLSVGSNYYFFESYVDQNGKRVFKDRFGNIQSAPNGLYYSDGDIYIDINAGTDSHSITLRTLSHELTHMIQQWSAAKYKAIADFLAEQYDKEGRSAYEAAKAKQAELSKLRGKTVSFQEAYHEFVADSMSTMFDDGNLYDILTDLKKKDKTIFEYIKGFFDGLAAKVRNLYANTQAETDEGQFVQGLSKETVYRLQQMFADALIDAGENYAASEQKNTDTQIGVQQQTRMTDADIRAVQNIGRISVNQFSASDIKATERFARQYWKEMGTKSPFFRAWFGDWRVNDQTKVQVATQKGNARGVQKNEDTGWDIQVSGRVFNETTSHNMSFNKAAVPYLPYINDIVRKAVLLDSSGIDIGRTKSNNSLLMHSLYAVADIGYGSEIIKLYVEEMNNPNTKDTSKRAYQLQNIEKYHFATKSSQNTASSRSVTSGIVNTVADLFDVVKQKDASFQPKPASKASNADGTPKIVYHGSAEQFTAFSYGHIGSSTGVGILGDGFYFTDKKQLAKNYGDNVYPAYLQMKKPYMATESDAYKLNVADLQAKGYDGVIMHTPKGDVYMVFENTQIKSAKDNIGTFDGGNPDIRYQDRTATPSNRELLAQALEGVATEVEDYQAVQEYRQIVPLLDAEEAKLSRLNAQIREMTFGKGSKDREKLAALRLEAKQTQNRIDIYDKQLLKLEATAPLRKVLEREKAKAYKKAAQKGKEAIHKEKERAQAKYDELAARNTTARKKAVAKARETAEKRDARAKLQKLVLDTAKWLAHPAKTDVKCPDMLKQPYADFLNCIDMTSERLAKGGDPTKNDLRMANAMGSLATALDRIMISQDPSQESTAELDAGYLDLPANFVQNLRDMTENVKAMMVEGDYVVNNMTAEEVRKLSQMIRTLNHAIKTMSTLYANLRFSNIEALGFDTLEFIDALGEIEKTGGMKDFAQWDNALPYYVFKRFGKGGESIFEGLMDAQDKLAFLAQKIFDFQEKTWTGKEAKAWSEDTHTIDLPDGEKLTLTTADAMSIYCLSRRQQGVQHLLGGGVRVVGIQKGSQKAKDSRSTLTIKDIDTIISSLTDRQKKVAEDVQEFMSTTCAEWGNEISMKRFLTKEFNEKFYFPIESNDENLPTKDPAAQQSDLFRLLNISATKSTDPRANNEVIIRNIFDVFTGHASDMARLNAYGMALLDYMKWLNYREKSVNDDGQINVRGVRKSMEKAYGNAAKSYVLNLIKDVNGRPSDNGDPTILMKWMRAAKTAAVGNSLRVATLQITAYPRAALVLSPKSLTLGLTKIPNIEKAKKYCGIALWKSFGFYDTNISRSIEEQMKGTQNIKQKLIELSLKGAELGDAMTWGALWNACEYDVASTKKYKVGSEEFYVAVGKKLREVVYRTQVVDSTLTRSQIMRSKRGMAQEAAAFMSEPTLAANILMDAGFQFNTEKRKTGSSAAAWKKTGKYICRSVAVYSIGQLTAALMEGLWDAWRDEDDEEFDEKFLNAFTQNLALDLVPFNKIPVVSDIFEAVLAIFDAGYYSSDKMSTTWLTQAVSAAEAWREAAGGNSSITTYNALYKTVRAMSSFFGVSVSGIMREGVALWNNTAGAYDPTLKVLTYGRSNTELGRLLLDAMIEGDGRQADSLRAEFGEEKDCQSAIRTAIKERFKTGEIDYDTAIKYLVDYGGEEKDDAFWKVEEWKHKDEADDYAKYNEFFDAVQTGKNLKVVIKKYTDNGVELGDLADRITNHFKPVYAEMSSSERARLKGYLLNAFELCGVARGDAEAKLTYWAFLGEYPDCGLSQSQAEDFVEFAKPARIGIEQYSDYCNRVKDITGDNKKERRMAVIDSMPISGSQKDALYYAEGWAISKLHEAPWH